MARTSVEVDVPPSRNHSLLTLAPATEQKKAALRRVEMELDEADEVV